MKLREALFQQKAVPIYQVNSDDENFLNWNVEPIYASTLAAEYVRDGLLDGFFIIKAILILKEGELQDCYMDVSMPERINDYVYVLASGEIIQTYSYQLEGEVIPAVAIEGHGVYELFYSRLNPEVGLNVLREGLRDATKKGHIAEDMAYIFRDENRHLEAIEAFNTVIAEGIANEYTYWERAALLESIGDLAGAADDLEKAQMILATKRR